VIVSFVNIVKLFVIILSQEMCMIIYLIPDVISVMTDYGCSRLFVGRFELSILMYRRRRGCTGAGYVPLCITGCLYPEPDFRFLEVLSHSLMLICD